jgi:hypothetical protein
VSEAESPRAECSALGGSGVREGPRGGIAQEPLLFAIDRAERRVADLRAELALTPLARRKTKHATPGRPPGAASAADRVTAPRRRGKVTPLRPPAALERMFDDVDAGRR